MFCCCCPCFYGSWCGKVGDFSGREGFCPFSLPSFSFPLEDVRNEDGDDSLFFVLYSVPKACRASQRALFSHLLLLLLASWPLGDRFEEQERAAASVGGAKGKEDVSDIVAEENRKRKRKLEKKEKEKATDKGKRYKDSFKF